MQPNISIEPNTTEKALILYNPARKNGLLGKLNSFLSVYAGTMLKTYLLFLLILFAFSLLGSLFYLRFGSVLTPLNIYAPFEYGGSTDFYSSFVFRQWHILAIIFTSLMGLSIYGTLVPILFFAADSFLVGFSVGYAIEILGESGYVRVTLYVVCIAAYIFWRMVLCSEALKYSKRSYKGISELFKMNGLIPYIIKVLVCIIIEVFTTMLFLTYCML